MLDGTERRASVYYPYRFDAAKVSPDGRFAVIYERLGTKGVLVDNGKIVREINRSYYFAGEYEYPVALFNDPTGRLVLAHCPDEYCRIELDDVVTGCRLTVSHNRKPQDFFHSRLTASPNGCRILSAGWMWHPWNAVVSFDFERAIADPTHLDRGDPMEPRSGYEEGSACWLDEDMIAVSGTGDEENLDDERKEDGSNLCPRGVAVYDVRKNACLRAFQLDEPPGTLVAVDRNHILSLYRHPKLINLEAGVVVHVWDELNSGLQCSSILQGLDDEAIPPPMAFDPIAKRFAIATKDTIEIIQFTSGT